ncbi:MAG: SUMF1/EgtB/PvdO family nonheme iron enzyme, partial [Candidatus Omnitrophica bacterium]|nr:SUMF1/EgtB/PvdO family nonheme iron enzyme [Candidatus Omnitrophota bacterium]
EHRNTGTQEHRNTGTQEHRNTGTQEHRNTGTQEHRNTGTQEHRNTPPYRRIFSCLIISFFISFNLYANALTVSNVTLTNQNAEDETIDIEFNINWQNSWRGSINHDAAWVFAKYSTDSGVTWHHATLKTSDSSAGYDENPTSLGYSQGTGTELDIYVPDDNTTTVGGGYGAFLYRSYPGAGTIDTDDITLVWDWGADGLTASTQARIKVFAIEMVYVPQGSFYIGDGDETNESTYAFHEDGVDNTAVQITATAKNINADGAMDMAILVDGDGGIDMDGTSAVDNPDWPTGYKGFYLMKYELSQGQYRDFLNTLTLAQQNKRTAATLDGDEAGDFVMVAEDGTLSSRQTITTESDPGSGPYTFGCDLNDDNTVDGDEDGEWIAMNYVSWMDLCAYADWAGLRPMTELEFEKACRGPNDAVYSEYAWGTTDITEASTISLGGTASEAVSETGKGLCNYYGSGSIGGPLRVGFAADLATNRQTAGSGYYGVMELSGNQCERCVTLGNSYGRLFEGTHGDGELTDASGNEGNATNDDWPGIDATTSYGVTGASGSGFRGGGWSYNAGSARVSIRNSAAYSNTVRVLSYGARCVR